MFTSSSLFGEEAKTMRCSAYEGCQSCGERSEFFLYVFDVNPRSGAESGAVAVGSQFRRPARLSTAMRWFFLFKAFFLSFPSWGSRTAGGLCLIGAAAFSCVGLLAPRTSSYPDGWGKPNAHCVMLV